LTNELDYASNLPYLKEGAKVTRKSESDDRALLSLLPGATGRFRASGGIRAGISWLVSHLQFMQ
jgi:hypothetical protein